MTRSSPEEISFLLERKLSVPMASTATADASVLHVVAVPYPARGHLNPMMSLCRSLLAPSSNSSIRISFIVTEEWAHLIATSATPSRLLRLVTVPDVLPPAAARGACMQAYMMAVQTKMAGPVDTALGGLQPKADVVITDALLPWAAGICGGRGVPVVALWTHSAAVMRAALRFGRLDMRGKLPVDFPGKEDRALAYIPRVLTPQFAGMVSDADLKVLTGFLQLFSWATTARGLLLSSPYELESQAIDSLRSDLSLPIYALGPCIPHMTLASKANPKESYYLNWLDSQPHRSVLYISLGSFLSASGEQLDEMVAGLNASGVRYLWVARDEEQKLKELDEELGMVVPWCDQLRVLCHPAVGGFLTHCGWNSTMEGAYAGVPMLTYPLIWDQYPNSKMIVDDWKVGLRLRDEVQIERVVEREEVAGMMKELMDLEAEESKQRRGRAEGLKVKCQQSIGEGGSSTTALDAFVQDMINKTKNN